MAVVITYLRFVGHAVPVDKISKKSLFVVLKIGFLYLQNFVCEFQFSIV